MKKFLALLLAFTFVFIIGCRSNAMQDDSLSATSNNNDNQFSTEIYDNTSTDVQSTLCNHYNTTTLNQISPTCVANGYSGDVCCLDCGEIVLYGARLTATEHDTEIRNHQDSTTSTQGYSGDTYCKLCNTLITKGHILPSIQETVPDGKIKYVSDNGYVYIIDKNINITDYSMWVQTQYIDSPYRSIEMEIFDLCNAEREKAGIAPLTWYEEAYYFTHIRSEEIYIKWDHQRPNSSDWYTVYLDADVILESCAENLAQQQGGKNIAEGVVDAWMNSTTGHRENILNPNYTKVAIAIEYVEEDYTICVAQHFFG